VPETIAERYLTCIAGRWRIAVPVRFVRGIEADPRVVPVSFAPSRVRGVYSLRGDLVAAVRVADLLDSDEPMLALPIGQYAVNVTAGDLAAGFLVDEVGEVIEAACPATQAGDPAEVAGYTVLNVESLLAQLLANH